MVKVMTSDPHERVSRSTSNSEPDNDSDFPAVDLNPLYATIDQAYAQTQAIHTSIREAGRTIDTQLSGPVVVTRLEASKTVYRCAGLLEELTRLLFKLDSVPSHGDATLRRYRKGAVTTIQAAIAEGEKVQAKAKELEARALTDRPAIAPADEATATAPPAEDGSDMTDEVDDSKEGEGDDVDTATCLASDSDVCADDNDEDAEVEEEDAAQEARAADDNDTAKTQSPTAPTPLPPQRPTYPQFTPPVATPSAVPTRFTPPAKMVDNHSHYLALAKIPHTLLRDVHFSQHADARGKFLTVSGKQSPQLTRNARPFEVTFGVPAHARLEAAQARLEGDVLHVTIPKGLSPMRSGRALYDHPMMMANPFSQFAW